MQDPAPEKAKPDRPSGGLPPTNPDDAPTSILQGVHDFGSAVTAVETKIDSAPCDGEVIAAFFTLIEAKAGGSGDDNDSTCIATDASTPGILTDDVKLDMSDTIYKNAVGSVVGAAPCATPTFGKGDDIYAYTNAQTGRSSGKYNVMIICKKV